MYTVKKVNGIADIRRKLGFTQLKFAALLQVNISALVMAENNERSLPTTASLKLAQIAVAFQAASNSANIAAEPHPAEKQLFIKKGKVKIVQLQEINCHLRHKRLCRQLEKMCRIYEHAKASLPFIEKMLEEKTADKENDSSTQWKMQHNITLEKIMKNSIFAQALLRMKISLALTEITSHEKLQQEYMAFIPDAFAEPVNDQ